MKELSFRATVSLAKVEVDEIKVLHQKASNAPTCEVLTFGPCKGKALSNTTKQKPQQETVYERQQVRPSEPHLKVSKELGSDVANSQNAMDASPMLEIGPLRMVSAEAKLIPDSLKHKKSVTKVGDVMAMDEQAMECAESPCKVPVKPEDVKEGDVTVEGDPAQPDHVGVSDDKVKMLSVEAVLDQKVARGVMGPRMQSEEGCPSFETSDVSKGTKVGEMKDDAKAKPLKDNVLEVSKGKKRAHIAIAKGPCCCMSLDDVMPVVDVKVELSDVSCVQTCEQTEKDVVVVESENCKGQVTESSSKKVDPVALLLSAQCQTQSHSQDSVQCVQHLGTLVDHTEQNCDKTSVDVEVNVACQACSLHTSSGTVKVENTEVIDVDANVGSEKTVVGLNGKIIVVDSSKQSQEYDQADSHKEQSCVEKVTDSTSLEVKQ